MFAACCCDHSEEGRLLVPEAIEAHSKFVEELQGEPVPRWSESATFECTLQPAVSLGLTCDTWPQYLQVLQLDGGSAQAYNAAARQGERILRNDLIVSVNGATQPKLMQEKLQQGGPITLKVVHPARSTIRLDRGDRAYGIKLSFQKPVSSCVRIDVIGEGAVQTYNKSATPDAQLHAQDLIESVNGREGVASRMVEEICASSIVELVLLRVPCFEAAI